METVSWRFLVDFGIYSPPIDRIRARRRYIHFNGCISANSGRQLVASMMVSMDMLKLERSLTHI
jgi:hypothetical protein